MAGRKVTNGTLETLVKEKLELNRDTFIEDTTDCKTDFICNIYRKSVKSSKILIEILLDMVMVEIIEANQMENALDFMMQVKRQTYLPIKNLIIFNK